MDNSIFYYINGDDIRQLRINSVLLDISKKNIMFIFPFLETLSAISY